MSWCRALLFSHFDMLLSLRFFPVSDETSPLTFSSSRPAKCGRNRATDSPNIPSRYRFFSSSSLSSSPSPPLFSSFEPLRHLAFESRCAVSPRIFRTETIREHTVSLFLRHPLLARCRIFALPLCQSVCIDCTLNFLPSPLTIAINSRQSPLYIFFALPPSLLLPYQIEFISKCRAERVCVRALSK